MSTIDSAKRLLMEQQGLTEDRAHTALRELSMETNQTLPQAANSVIQILKKNN
jgi:response regulator NasT